MTLNNMTLNNMTLNNITLNNMTLNNMIKGITGNQMEINCGSSGD